MYARVKILNLSQNLQCNVKTSESRKKKERNITGNDERKGLQLWGEESLFDEC